MRTTPTLTALLRCAFTVCVLAGVQLFGGVAHAQSQATTTLLVIVSNKTPTPTMTNKDVADLYLGRTRHLSNGQMVVPLDNPAAAPIRARFYKALTGKAITDINAYWARLLFTGQSSPPQPMADTNALLEAVRTTPGAMAYVEQSQVTNPEAMGLKVILSIAAP
ncbi:MAG: hypothetical protein KGL57_02150 [Burkholderiales bacterium]|nr:hypothetical protein [Burkholderiales bacterium]